MTSVRKSLCYPYPYIHFAYCKNWLKLTHVRRYMELGLPICPSMDYISSQQLVFVFFFFQSYMHIHNQFKCLMFFNIIQIIQVNL